MVIQMSPQELQRALTQGSAPRVIDVREDWEFMRSHIPGAEHMPLQQLIKEFKSKFPDTNEPVVVYCDLGIRSHHAATLLRTMGYQNVADLEGGLLAYANEMLHKGISTLDHKRAS